MRKLDRASVPAPQCLSQYRAGQHNWTSVGSPERAAIRIHLEQMQGRRCAYCEGSLDELGNHIEHFRPKGRHPALTFDWSNLYWSCDKNDSCGHHKDNGAANYDVGDLIDPCCDDPDQFFKFRADGMVDVRSPLSARDRHRAEETLRVFGLQAGHLRNMRKRILSGYLKIADDVRDMKLTPEQATGMLADELMATANSPFSTAIRHVLTESA